MQDCFSHSYLFLNCRQACCFEWDETEVHGNEMALTGSGGGHNGICPPPFAKDPLPLLTFVHDLFAKCQEQCRTSTMRWCQPVGTVCSSLKYHSLFLSPSHSLTNEFQWKQKLLDEIDLGTVDSNTWRNVYQHLAKNCTRPQPLFKVVPMPSSSLIQSASHWAAANISHGQWSVDSLRWRSWKGNCTITNLLKSFGRSITFDRIMCGMRRKYSAFEHLCGQEPVWASLEVETS